MSCQVIDVRALNELLNCVYQLNKASTMNESVTSFLRYKTAQKITSELGKNLTLNEVMQWIGEKIYSENVRAYNVRYDEKFSPNDMSIFKFKPRSVKDFRMISIIQALKLCDYLDYQLCEIDDYYTDENSIFWDVNKLKGYLTSKLDGYEQAKWGSF